jgi:hypothetical protein
MVQARLKPIPSTLTDYVRPGMAAEKSFKDSGGKRKLFKTEKFLEHDCSKSAFNVCSSV